MDLVRSLRPGQIRKFNTCAEKKKELKWQVYCYCYIIIINIITLFCEQESKVASLEKYIM